MGEQKVKAENKPQLILREKLYLDVNWVGIIAIGFTNDGRR